MIYFYDLPKGEVTSVYLANFLKQKIGLEMKMKAQFRKSLDRMFDSAIVKVDNVENYEKFKELVKQIKYFDINGKPCRALPFDREILG